MSPSTGSSGDSQPGRRARRRGRRGAGRQPDAAQDAGAAAANQAAANPAGAAKEQASSRAGAKSGAKTGGKTGAKTGGKAGKVAGKTGKALARKAKPGGRRLRTVDETSAGGLVVDASRASAALIGRLDRRGRLLWSLPKGHIEAGETPEQAAIREVAEETGIKGKVLAPLGTIDYWFVAEDRRVHKTVHHFLMEALGGELSDEDVEVTEVAWVPLGELDGRLAYADERRLVRLAAEMLSESA